MPEKRPNPTTIRLPQRAIDLITAIRVKTGFTFTQVILTAIEDYARKLGIKQ